MGPRFREGDNFLFGGAVGQFFAGLVRRDFYKGKQIRLIIGSPVGQRL